MILSLLSANIDAAASEAVAEVLLVEEKISFSLDEIDSEDEFASFINILEGKK